MRYESILLCQIFLKKEIITKNMLLEKGLSPNDIYFFIKNQYLIKKEDDSYEISVNLMYQYGEYLIKQNKDNLASECFNKCYELDNNHPGTNLRLILKSLREYDYEGIVKYLITLINSDNQTTKTDALVYLCLINYIIKLPKDLNDKVKKIKYDDIKITEENFIYKDVEKTNEIRIKIINKKFKHALKILNDHLATRHIYGVRNNILKSLLIRCLQVEEYNHNKMFNLIFEKKYQELLSFLCDMKEKDNLKISQDYLLKISKILLLSEIFEKLPVSKDNFSISVFDAIDNNDFKLAKEKCIKRNINQNKNPENDYIYILLNEICNKQYHNDNIYTSNYIYEEVNSYNVLFISYLKDNDKKNAIDNLYKYLENINKLDYLDVFLELLENNNYIELIHILHYMAIDNEYEKINIYIKRLEENFESNEIDNCYMYMKVIEKIKDKITDKYILNYINYLLDYYSKKLRDSKKNTNTKKLIYKKTL